MVKMKSIHYFCILITLALKYVICSNLALTFDATNSTCTAACTACPELVKTTDLQCHDEVIFEILNNTQSNAEKIQQILQQVDKIANTLLHVKNSTTTNSGTINDILLLVEELIITHNESAVDSSLPTSCKQIKQRIPNSPSGTYLIVDDSAVKAHYVYCYMEELCGSDEGWTRLAYLDMSDPSEECPSGFRLYESEGVRACGRPVTSEGSCVSVKFPSNGISYSEVCGRVVGYQYYTTDGLFPSYNNNDFNSYYVDGVSITHGNPRKHIWTFASGYGEFGSSINRCPCQQGAQHTPPSFIGNDYFCESGRETDHEPSNNFLYTSDPLWDGQQCGILEQPCCDVPGIPWFHKLLLSNNTITDDIELRVCCDQYTADEDVAISLYELYVKY